MRHLSLTEYRTTRSVPLDPDERDLLRSLVTSLVVTPSEGSRDLYDVTPGAQVGVLSVGDLEVEIRPKLPVASLFFLVSYAMERIRWPRRPFRFGEDDTVYEAVAAIFTAELKRALTRGLLQGYRVTDEAMFTVRGRIRIEDQIRRRYGRLLPVEIRYDDFTVDIDENRLLRSATHLLRRVPLRSASLGTTLRAAEQVFVGVTPIDYPPSRVPSVHYTRLNEHYRPAVELARLILQSGSIEAAAGRITGTAFIIDMNKVFEDFVVVALRDALGLTKKSFRQQRAIGVYLDHDERVRLEPDMSWWEGTRCVFVGDVKYKKTRAPEVPNADLYQLLSYAIGTDLDEALLVHPTDEAEPGSYDIRRAGKMIHVRTLDLAAAPEEILGEIEELARLIRLMRAQSGDERIPLVPQDAFA